MSPEHCDRCEAPFDPAEWHPATLDDGTVYEFCSPHCRRTFLATAGSRVRTVEGDSG